MSEFDPDPQAFVVPGMDYLRKVERDERRAVIADTRGQVATLAGFPDGLTDDIPESVSGSFSLEGTDTLDHTYFWVGRDRYVSKQRLLQIGRETVSFGLGELRLESQILTIKAFSGDAYGYTRIVKEAAYPKPRSSKALFDLVTRGDATKESLTDGSLINCHYDLGHALEVRVRLKSNYAFLKSLTPQHFRHYTDNYKPRGLFQTFYRSH